MMAKIFSILLTIVYGLSATGASVHLHYCCGKAQQLVIQLQHEAGHHDCPLCTEHQQPVEATAGCCDEQSCGDAEHDGHCQDVKVEAATTTKEHLPSNDKNLFSIYPAELLVFTLIRFANQPLAIHQAPKTTANVGSPPAVPLFIRHCTYLI
ncbi:hypothetical protein [Parapedobacter composti]|nr:hypothetical protein [Parapedobacter composti]